MTTDDTYLPVIYTALQVDDSEALMKKYPSDLPNKFYHHSTVRFGRQPFNDRDGETVRLHITGRLRNEFVDALVVDNKLSDNDIPHITLATAEGVKPFRSNGELASNRNDIEPLDDWVDTTFVNVMARKNPVKEAVGRLIEEAVRYVVETKKGGLNYASGDDEFYTREQDIVRELGHYDFDGKIVYCNCDNPSMSNFYKYFRDNFNQLGLRGLYATFYSRNPKIFYYDGRNETSMPIDSGRFQDNANVMEMCDVVVTNPPFSKSMPHQLVLMAADRNKDLVIVGPSHMARRNDMFDMIRNGRLRYGYTPINNYGPKGNSSSAWYTTMDVKRPFYHSGKRYEQDKYPMYDNYDAIECGSKDNVPDDYMGEMGVPFSFLKQHNPEQYDIIGKIRPVLNGKNLDQRMIIRRKQAALEAVIHDAVRSALFG